MWKNRHIDQLGQGSMHKRPINKRSVDFQPMYQGNGGNQCIFQQIALAQLGISMVGGLHERLTLLLHSM